MAKLKPRITETEWLTARGQVGLDLYRTAHRAERKWRLFGCACARRALAFLPDPVFAELVDAAERFAEGGLTWDEVKLARRRASAAVKPLHAELSATVGEFDRSAPNPAKQKLNAAAAVLAALSKAPLDALGAAGHAAYAFAEGARPNWGGGHAAEGPEQVRLAHDIFGNPFRPVAFSPAWRTSDAVGVARAMYAARDFSAAPILADALEDAGCDSAELLAHLRDPDAVHVRGCWAVDLALGKA